MKRSHFIDDTYPHEKKFYTRKGLPVPEWVAKGFKSSQEYDRAVKAKKKEEK